MMRSFLRVGLRVEPGRECKGDTNEHEIDTDEMKTTNETATTNEHATRQEAVRDVLSENAHRRIRLDEVPSRVFRKHVACRLRRQTLRSSIAVLALVAIIATLVTNPKAAFAATTPATRVDGFTIARSPYTFVFPRDHAAHDGYQTEWWYYTGHVRTAQGRRFGYELTFFRVGLRPGDPKPLATQSRWRGNQLYPAHFALTDEQGKTFFHVERFSREALGMGRASDAKLDIASLDWTLRGAPSGRADYERMVMHAGEDTASGRNAIDFVQMPEKKPAIHGMGGVSRKSSCVSCASHYYSYTRLKTTGTLEYRGQRFAIDGVSWMDHEYGSSELEPNQAGWDWFAIQLDDRRELMLYDLREKNGSLTPESGGSLVAPDGSVRYLPRTAFVAEATGRWKSPHTGGVYPSGWRVRVPSAGVDVTLAPTVLDQELAGTTSGVSYWEGAVDVLDARGKAIGVGYVELTGYSGSVSI